MDYGYHSTLGRTVLMHVSADNNMLKSRQGCLDLLNQRIRDLDQRADKQKFLELFSQPFTPPPPFEFHPHRNDEVRCIRVY
jgi:SLIT-ROBO Rho GTPase activating protein